MPVAHQSMVSVGSMSAPFLHHEFATRLPEFSAAAIPSPPASATPTLVKLNVPLATELGLDVDWLQSPDGLRFLLGWDHQAPSDGAHDELSQPVAQAYAGHQFGQFNPVMGDGRAILLGEVKHPATGQLFDLHVKGPGLTPLSRPGSDGKAGLGPALREYLVSEFMHAAGIPTARSLTVITTGGHIQRRTVEPAAAVIRVASSHVRVGSFQLARLFLARDPESDLLPRLADFGIDRHYPHLAEITDATSRYKELFTHIVSAHARLTAAWMRIGFIHGVMNTDNSAIGGFTLDYGPCAFMDRFDPTTVFSSIDTNGRYAYGRQPAMAMWNLTRLAEAMLPLFGDEEAAITWAEGAVQEFAHQYGSARYQEFGAALGIRLSPDEADDSHAIVDAFLALINAQHPDLTQLLWALTTTEKPTTATLSADADDDRGLSTPKSPIPEAFHSWVRQWLAHNPDRELMAATNLRYIPRNTHLEVALDDAVQGKLTNYNDLLAAVQEPRTVRQHLEHLAVPGPDIPGFRTYCGT